MNHSHLSKRLVSVLNHVPPTRWAAYACLCGLACGSGPDINVDLSLSGSTSTGRIIGGRLAPPYPWIARVLGPSSLCSGTLIAPRWVITARHCGQPTQVLLGSNRDDDGEFRRVAQVHTPADPDVDLALLELAVPVELEPIALNTSPRLPQSYGVDSRNRAPSNTTFIGWGLTEDGTLPHRLLEVDLPAVDSCDSTEICAGRDSAGVNSGDSGGPVIATTADGDRVLVGVTFAVLTVSQGFLCTRTSYDLAAATRVSSYLTWIREVAFQ